MEQKATVETKFVYINPKDPDKLIAGDFAGVPTATGTFADVLNAGFRVTAMSMTGNNGIMISLERSL
jgi:hypothetical protein